MSTLDALFSDLRGLMQRDQLDDATRRVTWSVLHRAWTLDPRTHAELFVP